MYPYVARLGPFSVFGHQITLPLHSYGLMLALAFLVCGHLLARELARRGMDPELSSTVVIAGVLGGIGGARLYYLIENWQEVRTNLLGSIFSGSGLVAYGGFAGAIALGWWMVRRTGASFLRVCDAAAPLLALGYAIGRIGCFLAGDGDYGPPSDLPWAMAFPRGIEPTVVPVHPTPLYETLAMTVVFAILWRLRRRPWPVGKLFALYLMLQGVERFVIEFWRVNPQVALGLTAAQWIAAATFVAGLAWFTALRGKPAIATSDAPRGTEPRTAPGR